MWKVGFVSDFCPDLKAATNVNEISLWSGNKFSSNYHPQIFCCQITLLISKSESDFVVLVDDIIFGNFNKLICNLLRMSFIAS